MNRLEVPQAFVDAVCDERSRLLSMYVDHPDLVEVAHDHTMHRYRGVAGVNGVGCDVCRDRAYTLWQNYLRIVGSAEDFRLSLSKSAQNKA